MYTLNIINLLIGSYYIHWVEHKEVKKGTRDTAGTG